MGSTGTKKNRMPIIKMMIGCRAFSKMLKALYPESFVNEMKEEIEKMCRLYK